MNRLIFACMACLALLPSGIAQARTDHVLKRSTSWALRYDDKTCDMTASFTRGKRQVTATITAYAPWHPFQIAFAGDGMDWSHPDAEAWFGVGANPRLRKVDVLSALGAHRKPMLIMKFAKFTPTRDGGSDAQEPDLQAGTGAVIDEMTFVTPSGTSYRLQTGDMRDPQRVIRQCAERLEMTWGYKPWEQEKLVSHPEPRSNAQDWFRDSDYPERASAMGVHAYLRFRVDVGADGAVTGCRVLFALGPDGFEDAACGTLARRAQFAPARDGEGRAVASYTIATALFH